ncbi:MAG: thioredoxin family protein [Paludibacteraceae bacterium]|nr:thioredoxin family protein [Paludibacteraceae bacterium]
MKEIKILGTGCSSCKALYASVEKAVAEMGLNVKVTKEEDIVNIMAYNVMTLPAVVIDEKVVAKGKMGYDQVKELLNNYK